MKRSLDAGHYDDEGFRNEILLLSSLHHRNLVSLVGYCLSDGQLLLVYEFVAQGSLESLLAEEPSSPRCLSWAQRMSIAVGAARGLDYLHSQIMPPILHLDIKVSRQRLPFSHL